MSDEDQSLVPKDDGGEELELHDVESFIDQQIMYRIGHDQFTEKLTDGHIDKILDIQDGNSQREHNRETLTTVLSAVALGFVVLIVAGLCWLFLAYDKSEFILPLVTGLGGLISGGLAGFGIGRMRRTTE